MSEEYKNYCVYEEVTISYPVYVRARSKEDAIEITKEYGLDLVVDLLDQADVRIDEDYVCETPMQEDFDQENLHRTI